MPSARTVDEHSFLAALGPVGAAADLPIVFSGDYTWEDEELINAAWHLLQLNTDLVTWATCWAAADVVAGEEIIDILMGADRSVTTIWFADDTGSGAPFSRPDAETIRVRPHGVTWLSYKIAFDGSESTADRACSIVDLASTLFHELTHRTGPELFETSATCEAPYVTENIFKWALLMRYPFVLLSECCDNYRESFEHDTDRWGTCGNVQIDDSLWGLAETDFLDGCLTTSTWASAVRLCGAP